MDKCSQNLVIFCVSLYLDLAGVQELAHTSLNAERFLEALYILCILIF